MTLTVGISLSVPTSLADKDQSTARTSQHILIPRQNLLIRNIDRPFPVLLHQHSVRVHDSVRGDIRHIGGIDKRHVGGEFAIDSTREPDTILS